MWNLSTPNLYPVLCLNADISSRLVVFANRLTAGTMASEGRFSTHCPMRCRLSVVGGCADMPSMQRSATHEADDMGARLGVPSGFSVEIMSMKVPIEDGGRNDLMHSLLCGVRLNCADRWMTMI